MIALVEGARCCCEIIGPVRCFEGTHNCLLYTGDGVVKPQNFLFSATGSSLRVNCDHYNIDYRYY
jgi:hypothetical protein